MKSKTKSLDEEHTQALFKKNLRFQNGRYYVQPLFKKDYIPMLNNYNIAIRRYKSQRNQLAKKLIEENSLQNTFILVELEGKIPLESYSGWILEKDAIKAN